MSTNPFEALGLPARPDLTDEQVRAAWRAIAAATHPDRPDGGDLARYTAASAAYAELRTPWGRSEAYADLAERAGDGPVTAPIPVVPGEDLIPSAPPWQPLIALVQIPARIRRGRPLRLLIRAAISAVLSLVVLRLIPRHPGRAGRRVRPGAVVRADRPQGPGPAAREIVPNERAGSSAYARLTGWGMRSTAGPAVRRWRQPVRKARP